MKGRADSPSIPRTLGDHEDRVRNLEFAITAADLINAIRYGLENVGDWLEIKTTDAGGPSGYAIHLDDSGGFGLLIESDGGPLDFDVGSTTWHTVGNNVWTFDGGVTIYGAASAAARLQVDNSIEAGLDAGEAFRVLLAAGAKFEVTNRIGVVKIRWTEGTNDLHIPTGGTIVADL